MLVKTHGERIFNNYDLSAVLDEQLSKVKNTIEEDIRRNSPTDQVKYVISQIEKYKINPIVLNDSEIKVENRREMISSEYFPTSFFEFDNKSFEKEVYRFHIPYTGDSVLLRCVPSTRILWTEEVIITDSEIIYDVIDFQENVEVIKSERDKVKGYIISQLVNVNGQVKQYNENLRHELETSITQIVSKLSKENQFTAALGIPLTSVNNNSNAVKTISNVDTVSKNNPKAFDVFICHASEDKVFVAKLAKSIRAAGFEVWYDDFQLGWGDDLRSTIDDGIKRSEYGIIVLSKAFLAKKKWTEHELDGLFAKEKIGKKVILPLWYKVGREDIAEYSLPLADRLAKQSDSIDEIISELKKLIPKA